MCDRLNSKQDLLNMYDRVKCLIDQKMSHDPDAKRIISVCSCTGCAAQDSLDIVSEINRIAKERGLEDKIFADITGCFGFCARGPIVKIYPDNIFYVQVHKEDAERIVDSILSNEYITTTYRDTIEGIDTNK